MRKLKGQIALLVNSPDPESTGSLRFCQHHFQTSSTIFGGDLGTLRDCIRIQVHCIIACPRNNLIAANYIYNGNLPSAFTKSFKRSSAVRQDENLASMALAFLLAFIAM